MELWKKEFDLRRQIKAKVGCDFCRNVVNCGQMPIYRDAQLYLSTEKAGLLQNVCPGKGGVGC